MPLHFLVLGPRMTFVLIWFKAYTAYAFTELIWLLTPSLFTFIPLVLSLGQEWPTTVLNRRGNPLNGLFSTWNLMNFLRVTPTLEKSKIIYSYFYLNCTPPGSKDCLQFILTWQLKTQTQTHTTKQTHTHTHTHTLNSINYPTDWSQTKLKLFVQVHHPLHNPIRDSKSNNVRHKMNVSWKHFLQIHSEAIRVLLMTVFPVLSVLKPRVLVSLLKGPSSDFFWFSKWTSKLWRVGGIRGRRWERIQPKAWYIILRWRRRNPPNWKRDFFCQRTVK